MKSNSFRSACIIVILIFLTHSFSVFAEKSHVLQKGETLYSLSRKYSVSVDEIMKLNHISDPGSLKTGMVLLIEESSSTSQSLVSPSQNSYTAQKGDTYYSIARKAGMKVGELFTLNGLDSSSVLKPGDIIQLNSNISASLDKKISDTTKKITPTTISIQKTTTASDPFAAFSSENKGKLLKTISPSEVPYWPVSGEMREIDGKQGGVIISADNTSFVRAIAGGTVVWTGPFRGFGKVVLVDVNGYIYLYGGNDDIFVNRGENIEAGKRIGRLAVSSRDKGELYFSILKEGSPVNLETAPRG